jgi:hypothetical protein
MAIQACGIAEVNSGSVQIRSIREVGDGELVDGRFYRKN